MVNAKQSAPDANAGKPVEPPTLISDAAQKAAAGTPLGDDTATKTPPPRPRPHRVRPGAGRGRPAGRPAASSGEPPVTGPVLSGDAPPPPRPRGRRGLDLRLLLNRRNALVLTAAAAVVSLVGVSYIVGAAGNEPGNSDPNINPNAPAATTPAQMPSPSPVDLPAPVDRNFADFANGDCYGSGEFDVDTTQPPSSEGDQLLAMSLVADSLNSVTKLCGELERRAAQPDALKNLTPEQIQQVRIGLGMVKFASQQHDNLSELAKGQREAWNYANAWTLPDDQRDITRSGPGAIDATTLTIVANSDTSLAAAVERAVQALRGAQDERLYQAQQLLTSNPASAAIAKDFALNWISPDGTTKVTTSLAGTPRTTRSAARPPLGNTQRPGTPGHKAASETQRQGTGRR